MVLREIQQRWKWLTEGVLHKGIRRLVVSLATNAARNPKRCLAAVSLLSLSLAIVGLNTNFTVIYDQDKIFTPFNSLPSLNYEWIKEESGFEQLRPFYVLLHDNGDNVLSAKSVRRLFQAYDTLFQTDGVADACEQSQFLNGANEHDCRVLSATQFWGHSREEFELDLADFSTEEAKDAYVMSTLSHDTFPDGTPVFYEGILGNFEQKNRTKVVLNFGDDDVSDGDISSTTSQTPSLESAQSFIVKVDIPDLGDHSDVVEKRILARMDVLQQQWEDENAEVVLEYFTMHAYTSEFQAAIMADIPLVMVMFVIMISFCCFVFADRKNKVQSRSLMGLFSILSIVLSLASGYGLVWIIGVPFTNISLMLPFLTVGIGLDDTFVITGAYFRKSNQTDIVKRVQETMEDVGLSITLTTTTTMLAFLLGAVSAIPSIRWLCIYGAVTIAFVFFYQCTCFIACLTLDERRVQANKRDCCICITAKQDSDDNEEASRSSDTANDSSVDEATQQHDTTPRPSYKKELPKNFSERFMGWYADQLLRPTVKRIVLVAFAAYFAVTAYTTSLLTQNMVVEDYVQKDSHARTFIVALEEYSSLFGSVAVYFRNVNQSDPVIQQQMLDYVDEISSLEQIGAPPEFFWLRDLKEMVNDTDSPYADYNLQDYTFDQQVDIALSLSQIRDVYGGDIVRDPDTGEIIASRTHLFLRGMDEHSASIAKQEIGLLLSQRGVTLEQPVNEDKEKDDLSFFVFDPIFFFWELYAVSVQELVFTTVAGVVSVSAVAFFLIPHWSAPIFVCGTIIMVYLMLLGTMQMAGLYINAVTYVIIVMAIGLLVDFLMHVLLRYYETTGTTRNAKVKETLETIGASVLLGGLTTWLGVIPLAFSSTTIFTTVFISFLAMVSLGCGIGLTLLPVVLSLVGPVVTINTHDHDGKLSKHEVPDMTAAPSFQCTETSSQGNNDSDTSREETDVEAAKSNNVNQLHLEEVFSNDSAVGSPRGRGVYTLEVADSKDCPIGIECGRGREI